MNSNKNNIKGRTDIFYSKNKKAWITLFVVYLASIAATISMMKVPPLMTTLIIDLRTDATTGGLFMSTFMIAGVVLAIPVASLLNNWGYKKCGLIALTCTTIGSIVGSLAKETPIIMLIGRLIEGIGFAFIMVVAPAIISLWFDSNKRGLPMGIWATWVPVGMLIIYNLVRPLESLFSWRGVWYFNALYSLIVFYIFYKLVDCPSTSNINKKYIMKKQMEVKEGLKNLNSWWLAIIFFLYGVSIQGYNAWLPSFLVKMNVEALLANFNASMVTMGSIPAILIAGLILNCIQRHKYILLFGLTISIITYSFWFNISHIYLIAPWMVMMGLSTGFIPTCIFSLATETVIKSDFIGIALALVNMGFNFGNIIGPPIIGYIIDKNNLEFVKYFVIIPLIIAIILAFNIDEKK